MTDLGDSLIPDDTRHWAQQITAAWQSSLHGIFETGRLLAAAKAELPHGSFLRMISAELPFKPATAQRLMKIAADERLTNAAHAQLLPPSWMTLYELTKLPTPVFEAKLASGEIHPEMQRKDIAHEAARVERNAKLAEIAQGNAPLGLAEHYPVILADPPWRYENPPMGATGRAIENHYPTMTLADICALPVSGLATPDAVLFLWATAPKLAECLEVIRAWDFTYRTHLVWVKDKIGMGYHVRNQHELLLIAKRGEVPAPPPEARPSSVLYAPRAEHSVKPPETYRIIESMYPDLPRIELFARAPQDGWASWGNQAVAA
jgi:N6-adenosine-specific RNA methylase IME4